MNAMADKFFDSIKGKKAIISRSLGNQDTHAATKFASTSFFTALVFGIVLAGVGLSTLPGFMMLLGSTDTILPHACAYARPILIAAPLMMSSLVMNNILRYEGKASFAMIGLVTGGVLNIVLDPVFIFGLGMGTGGAGTATALSQSISFCILLSMFLRGKTVSRFRITQVTRSARDFGLIFFTDVAKSNPVLATLLAFVTFAVTFLARPFGSVLLSALLMVDVGIFGIAACR